jgi:hypothetical protein
MTYVGEYCGYYLNLPIFSQSLCRGGDWNLGVQLTLFQPVEERGEDDAHHITAYKKVTYV